ncbi:hypothetical protein Tco_0558001 [Tanacetum coccineum]
MLSVFFLRKHLTFFCEKFHIPEEIHPVLPNRGDTIHERPARKIGLYTRFFDIANFRLPLSTFLVNILRHFHINISQLFVIGAAKVSHFEILCRVYEIVPTVGLFRCFYVNSKKNGWISFSKRSDNAPVCYTKPLDYLKNWNNHFFWVDDFACPASFPWHTARNVTRDHAPAAADFNAQAYATLVAHPSPFRKFPEEFLCLTTVGRTVPLLPIAPDRTESELDASVDRIFKEGGSGNQTEQGDSAGGSRQGVNIQPVIEAADAAVEDVAPAQPKRQRKRKTVVADSGGPSRPPKKLREDHGTSNVPSVAGKSSAPQRFVISSNSSHHSGANVAEAEVDSLVRSFVLVMIAATATTSTVDPVVVVKEKTAKPSLFAADSSSAGGADPNVGVFSDLTGSDFLVSGVCTVIDPDTDLQKVYVPQWSVTNGSRLDDGRVCSEMVDEFAPPKLFASVRGMEHEQLFTEFNVGTASQMSLSAEVRMCVEYNIKENRRLKSVVDEKNELLKAMDEEIENLKAHMLLKEAEAVKVIRLRAEASNFETVEKSFRDEVNALNERNAILEKERNTLDEKVADLEASAVSKEHELADLNAQLTFVKCQNDNLVDRVHELEVSSFGLQEKVAMYENCMGQLEKFQDDRMKEVNDKFDKLYADFIEMALHLEEKFYHHLLTTISDRRWLLTHGIELAISKCLNSPEYISAFGVAISKAIEKGMQDGLSAGITHGKEGRVLTDVAAYNPSAEVDYVFAL